MIHRLPPQPAVRAIIRRDEPARIYSFSAYRAARLIERDDPMAILAAAEAIEERVRQIRAMLDEQAEAAGRMMW